MAGKRKPFEKRFWEKVKMAGLDDCWLWQAAVGTHGYGVIGRGRVAGHENITSHRAAWEIANKRTVPDGQHVLHLCDVKRCCNPRHLYLGTAKDNMRDVRERNPGAEARRVAAIRRGATHPRAGATINADTALKILRAPGPQKAIAELYGVSVPTVSDIKRRHTWKHIDQGENA